MVLVITRELVYAVGDFGEELRALMVARGISGNALAKQVPCDAALVSRYLSGKQRPSRWMADRFDEVLAAGGKLAMLAPHPPAAELPIGRLFPATATCPDGYPPADADYVDELRHTTWQLAAMDTRHGGDDVLALAARAFRSAHTMLASGAYLPGVEHDLQAAVGAAGELTAWIAYDADQQPQSRLLCHEAMLSSRLAGDRSMELFDLTHLAMQSVHLHRSAEALRIADDLLDGPQLADRVAAVFLLRRGRALAQLGDRPRALAAVGKVRSLIADEITSRDPDWTWWLDDAELAWHEGMAHAELGDWPAAVELFWDSAAGRDARGRARDRYNDTAHLLNALVHVEAWTDAEPVAARLIGIATAVGSVRIANLLRRVTRRITDADTTTTLADSAEELARVLDGGPLA
jgi:tetratricopeptide (TPR) repeat protein